MDGDPPLPERLSNDESVLPIAKEAHAREDHLRAVLRADSAIHHGRVIRVLDLLRQAGIRQISFAVSASAPEPKRSHAAPLEVEP